MGVESVSVAEALSQADTLEISCHSPTRVLLPALESMESKRHTSYRSCSTNIYIQNHGRNYWERLHELKLYSLQSHRERYIIIYIWKITQHMVPNIDGTIGHTIKTIKHLRNGTQCVIQYSTNRNPAQSLEKNAINVFGPRLYNSMPKYLRDIESVKIEKFKFESDKFLELIPDDPKMPNYVTASGSNSILDQLTHLRAQGIYVNGGVPSRPRSSLSCLETTPSIQVQVCLRGYHKSTSEVTKTLPQRLPSVCLIGYYQLPPVCL